MTGGRRLDENGHGGEVWIPTCAGITEAWATRFLVEPRNDS